MQGTYCLQYMRLRAGETSAMSNFMKADTAWKKPVENHTSKR